MLEFYLEVPEFTQLRGTGPVRFGSSHNSAQAGFTGDMTCIMYHYLTAMRRITEGVSYNLMCDPSGVLVSAFPLISG